MTDLSQPASVTEGGQTITSTSESVEQIRETMQPPDPEPEPDEDEGEEERPRVPKKVSKAAAELGKRGGEASAEARRAAKEAEDEEADAVAEAEELEKAGKLGKARHDPRARMLAATREAKAAKAEREAAKAEAETAKRERDALKAEVERSKTAKPTEAPAKTEAPGKPVPASFTTYEEYIEALADYKTEQRFKERDAKAAEEARVKDFAKQIDDGLTKARGFREDFEKTHPDFKASLSDDVKAIANKPSFVRDLHGGLYSDHVISDELIIAGVAGPPMMVYLSQHPEELQRIRALSVVEEIQLEMRILARTLGAASTATSPKREVSKAPQPIRPVTGGPHIDDSDEPDENAPLSAFIKRDNARRAREASR